MGCQDIAPYILTKDFKSGTIVEYNCKNCGELCKKQAMSLYYQTKERIEKGDRRLYWCQKCTLKSPEFLNKASESAIKSNQSQRELKIELSDWQLKLKEYCPDITANTIQDDKVKYICKCGSVCEARAKGLLKLLNKNGELRCQPCSMKKLWEDKEYKEKRIASINEQFAKPEYIEKHKQNNLDKWKNDDFRKIFSSDEINEKKSESMKRKWEDEKYREKIVSSFTDERRHKMSETMKNIFTKEQQSERGKISARKKVEENKDIMEYSKNNLNKDLTFKCFIGSSKIQAVCNKGHTITVRLKDHKNSCFECNNKIHRAKHPKYEQYDVSKALCNYSPTSIKIGRREIDIYLEKYNIGIEYCGQYWHSELNIDKNRHIEKHKLCTNNNIYLITLYESEWLNNSSAVINYVESFTKKEEVTAFTIEEISISDAICFLTKNSPIIESFNMCYGVYTDKLVQVICFDDDCVTQYVKTNNISGDVERLIKTLDIKTLDLDNRFIDYYWFSKHFKQVEISDPDFKWCKREHLYDTYNDIPDNYKKSKSLSKIYDCGRTKYALVVKEDIIAVNQTEVLGARPNQCSKKCYQKTIKESTYYDDLEKYGEEIFNRDIDEYVLAKEELNQEIKKFIEKYEWIGTIGVTPKWVFTARIDGVLACVECLNTPNAFSEKLLNIKTNDIECLIQRGASSSFAHKNIGSKLIRYACNWMVNNTNKRIFVAYSDQNAGEIGTVYSASGFDWLGWNFGTKVLYKNNKFKNGQTFNQQSLRRTSQLIKWYKEDFGTNPPSDIFNPKNGFKDMKKMGELHPNIKVWFNNKIKEIISDSTPVKQLPKGKWVLVLGKNKKDQRFLDSLKIYKSLQKPKRIYENII